MLPSVNEIFEREISNPMVQSLCFYFSELAFVVSVIDPNKQFLNVKSVFKFLNYELSVYEIQRFIAFLGIELLLFIKQCPLKFVSGNAW